MPPNCEKKYLHSINLYSGKQLNKRAEYRHFHTHSLNFTSHIQPFSVSRRRAPATLENTYFYTICAETSNVS